MSAGALDSTAPPTPTDRPSTGGAGVAAGVGAYALWGVFPLFWPLLAPAGAVEVLAHRVVWSLLLVGAALLLRRRWAWVRGLVATPRALAALAVAAVLISANWGLFIWAVSSGHVVDASLGYFINPLVSVVLGVVVLGERLDAVRWTAVGLASAGVAWLTVDAGAPPWVALGLAGSFAVYGLIKKLATVGPLEGLAVETAVLLVPAVAYLGWLAAAGRGTFLAGGPSWHDLLLASAGPATAVPLLLFAAAARRIPLSTLGMLQYLAPTLQLACGVLLLGEDLDARQLVGFALVWAALLLLVLRLRRP